MAVSVKVLTVKQTQTAHGPRMISHAVRDCARRRDRAFDHVYVGDAATHAWIRSVNVFRLLLARVRCWCKGREPPKSFLQAYRRQGRIEVTQEVTGTLLAVCTLQREA